jgi:tetratricopeptide (TPR) repeat protein
MRLACSALLILAAAPILAQEPANLADRIRASHLPVDQRNELAALFAAKNYARMQEILDRQAVSAGNSPLAAELHALCGDVEFLRGRMDQANAAFRQADSLTPLDEPDRFTWAMALLNTGDSKAARAQLTSLISAHPGRPLYLYWLARIDYDERLYADAIEKLKRVIQLDPSSSRAYDNLGLAYDMSGQPAEARQAFLKAADLNRRLPHPSAWPPHNLGYLLLRLEQPKDAETALLESLTYDPKLAIARYHLGRVLEAEGRDSEAISEYRAAINLDPKAIEPLYSLGRLYQRNHHPAEADAAFAEYKRRRAASPEQ